MKPDFKTIADFRRDNRAAFRAVFRQFVFVPTARPVRPRVAGGRRTRIKAVNNKIKLHPLFAARVHPRADERLKKYLKRLDEGDVEDGATGGVARTKNLAENIAALNESAAVTKRCWRNSTEPARTRSR